MADSNEDLLEGEGDLVDGEFDIDGADEDALLADDYEDIKTSSKSQRNSTHRNHEHHHRNREEATEDEDAIELGVVEDLGLPDDEKSETWPKSDAKSSERNQFEYNSKNADSDEEDGEERDRSRFKTERNITVRARATSAIPETLDGVLVGRTPTSRGGRAKGKTQTSYRGRYNQNNPIQRNNFIRHNVEHHHHQQQHLPMPHQHHQPPPPMQAQHQQHAHLQHPLHQPQQHPLPPQLHLQPRPVQPNNIHVNPHFRPRPPINVPSWQGNAPNNYPPPQPPYSPHFNNNFQSQPVQPRPAWNETPQHYYDPPSYPPHPNYQDNFYNGPHPQEPVYYNQHPQHQNMNMPSVPPYQANNWENSNYYPTNQDVYVQNQPPLAEPHHQQVHPPPYMRPLNHVRPQFQRGNSNFIGKGRMNKLKLNVKRDGHLMNNKLPPKLQRMDMQRKVSRNLHQVQTVDNLPEPTITVPEPEVCTQVEEDEEMKEYRMKIEEQKKLREEILRKKEENRAEAAQQRQQKEKMGKMETGVNNTVSKGAPIENKTSTKDAQSPENQFKIVRVRLRDGKTIVRKLSLSTIQKFKKVQPDGKIIKTVKIPQDSMGLKSVGNLSGRAEGSVSGTANVGGDSSSQVVSKIVAIENLSATTTKKQLLNMAKQVGAVQSVELDSEPGKATVKFETNSSATAFIQKFQRKMVDLSMITLTLVPE